jgi:two-component system cell cycle response regulator
VGKTTRMSFVSRLTAFFVAAVALPMVLAGILIVGVVRQESARRVDERLRAAEVEAGLLTTSRAEQVSAALDSVDPALVRSAFTSTTDAQSDLGVHFKDILSRLPGVDIIVATEAEGTIAQASRPASFRGEEPSALAIGTGDVPGVITARLPVTDSRGNRLGAVSVGAYLDASFVQELSDASGVQATTVADGRVLASTLPARRTADLPKLSPGAIETTDLGGEEAEVLVSDPVAEAAGTQVLFTLDTAAFAKAASDATRTFMLLLMAACVIATGVGWLIARYISRPVIEVSEGALAIAEGNWTGRERVPVRSNDEIGQLAAAFNKMTAHLRTYVREAEQSRSELEGTVVRFGAMLERTHDREGILTLVTTVSRRDFRARGAALYVASPLRNRLELAYLDGTCGDLRVGDRIAYGRGVAGRVAETGQPARSSRRVTLAQIEPARPVDSTRVIDTASTSPPEPPGDAVAVVIRADERLFGVLALYGRVEAPGFTDAEVELLADFARQTGVAIDNVLLHEEANRLAIRDAVTGIWNRRYFDIVIEPELERSSRFRHPMGLIMLDLDDFKAVNDTYGHPAGDDLLMQVAHLVNSQVREVDTVARYGGEEFVVILPETDLDGALVAAEKIRVAVADYAFHVAGVQLEVTASLGVAAYPVSGETAATLVLNADRALYEAKRLGKNRVAAAKG